jgi:hypothetical protein
MAAKRLSVVALPRERIAAMIFERILFETWSIETPV